MNASAIAIATSPTIASPMKYAAVASIDRVDLWCAGLGTRNWIICADILVCAFRKELWSPKPDLNQRPSAYKAAALPTELFGRDTRTTSPMRNASGCFWNLAINENAQREAGLCGRGFYPADLVSSANLNFRKRPGHKPSKRRGSTKLRAVA
jgi:hypothetical protein